MKNRIVLSLIGFAFIGCIFETKNTTINKIDPNTSDTTIGVKPPDTSIVINKPDTAKPIAPDSLWILVESSSNQYGLGLKRVKYFYDTTGRPTFDSVFFSNKPESPQVITYEYDSLSRMSKVKKDGNMEALIEYNASNHLQRIHGIHDLEFIYLNSGRLDSIVETSTGDTCEYKYSYENNNITKVVSRCSRNGRTEYNLKYTNTGLLVGLQLSTNSFQKADWKYSNDSIPSKISLNAFEIRGMVEVFFSWKKIKRSKEVTYLDDYPIKLYDGPMLLIPYQVFFGKREVGLQIFPIYFDR